MFSFERKRKENQTFRAIKNGGHGVVSLAAVIRVVTQRLSPKTLRDDQAGRTLDLPQVDCEMRDKESEGRSPGRTCNVVTNARALFLTAFSDASSCNKSLKIAPIT